MASVQGWGRLTWGSGTWGQYAPVEATGVSLTSTTATPTITGDCNITLTGVYSTSTAGDPTAVGIANVTVVQAETLNSNTNDVTTAANADVSPTANGLTAILGEETAGGVAQSGWGRGYNADTGTIIGWGDNLWGTLETEYALTGASATTSTGDMTFQGDVAPTITAAGLSSSVGDVLTSIFVTGVSPTSSIGTFSITAGAEITVVAASEPELDATTGDVVISISPTVEPAGTLLTGSLGSSTITGDCNVTLTAEGMTSSLGEETINIDVDVDADGNALTSSEGDVTPAAGAIVTPTGQAATSAVGDATQTSSYALTGVSATASPGNPSIEASSTLTLTGVEGTVSTGDLDITGWNVVDDSNSSISWVEVTKAA